MPLPTCRRPEVDLGTRKEAEGSDDGSTTRVWRPLRLSRERHVNSIFNANRSSSRSGDFSFKSQLWSLVPLTMGAECLNVARVGFKKENGPVI